ncbi:MAG: DUF2934 domain-containing protein [Rhodopseudomonas sp.]|uniref:DUF2934 domain-containing protein n=1 Tax=Rhodopseudomonas sp. TaxID=1078 RepID=UPI0017A33340|nr:DUF2934 domain-containing protein [Rhodopseudomonas sp.]NVN88051.1 DUF2934 domain-containing protein [Rhodopseudomonas sp.]
MDQATQNLINCRAYQLWETAGQPSGRDTEFWLIAEQEIAPSAKPAESVEARPEPAEMALVA